MAFCLSSALAGGAGPRPPTGELTRRAALEAVEGVRIVEGLPFDDQGVVTASQMRAQQDYIRTRQGLYTVVVSVRGQTQRVYVTPGGSEGSETLNTVRVHLNAVIPTPTQREALVRVALGFFNVCWPAGAQSLSDPFWQARLARPWEKDLGWQDGRAGRLKVGWGAGEAFRPFGPTGPYRAAMDLTWPINSGRCQF